jgi:hypothetical protein
MVFGLYKFVTANVDTPLQPFRHPNFEYSKSRCHFPPKPAWGEGTINVYLKKYFTHLKQHRPNSITALKLN